MKEKPIKKSEIIKITICICTYKRPALLMRLLLKIENQKTDNLFTFDIVVIDNDKQQSAQGIVKEFLKKSIIVVNYFIEPEQNIAMARNKAIMNATGEYLAFIDDDEFPGNEWLLNMLKAINKYKADGILGPVLPHFEHTPPVWILRGHFFDRPAHTSGYILDWQDTRTGNVLIKNNIIKKSKIKFDPLFGSGGEDRDFFKKLISEGYVFKWCNEAPVYETVLKSRCSRSVMIKRALLRGKMSLNALRSKHASIILSIAAIGIYSICLPIFFIIGQHVFMKYVVKTCDHLGKIFAFIGINLVKDKYISG